VSSAKKNWSEQIQNGPSRFGEIDVVPTDSALKAPVRPCKGCDGTIPPQPSGPGRPREFCSRRCRRDYYHRQEQAEVDRERREEWERQRYELDRQYYGKREANRRAKQRAREREEWA